MILEFYHPKKKKKYYRKTPLKTTTPLKTHYRTTLKFINLHADLIHPIADLGY